MNTRLNGAKICQIKVVGSSGTGTTLTGTGTSPSLPVGTGTTLSSTGSTCLLHNGYRYHFLVPVPIRDFAQKMSGFGIFTHFSSINLLPFHPISKIRHGIHPKQLQRWFRINENPFSLKLGLFPKIKIIKEEVRV